MAKENDKWIIEIRDGEGSGDSKKKKMPLNTLQRIISNPGQLLKSSLLESAEELYKANQGVGLVAGAGVEAASKFAKVVANSAEGAWNRYCTLQEDYMTQQSVANVKSTVNKMIGASSAAVSGSKAMQGFGPMGSFVGMAIGIASYGANQYIEYQKRMSNYYQQLNSTNFQTEFTASRMGLSNNGRGTEN